MPAATAPSHELFALSDWFAALRRSGWFSEVPSEAWTTLSALLSLPSQDGSVPFTLEQLAYVLGIDEGEAERRLDDLSQTSWKGLPLLVLLRDASGRVCGAAPAFLGLFTDGPPPGEASPTPSSTSPVQLEPSSASLSSATISPLARRLEEAGLYPDQVERLLSAYPEERVVRQLDWLPARKAHVPAAMLVRAVEGDWGPPREKAEEPKPLETG